MKILLLAAMMAISGCALVPPPQGSEEAKILARPLLCEGKERCDVMWRKAQLWVAQNSYYKIQIATDVLIRTHGPIGTNAYFAHQVTREHAYGQTEEIKLVLLCPNLFGCGSRAEQVASFQSYVGG